jgi:hypothetical protein
VAAESSCGRWALARLRCCISPEKLSFWGSLDLVGDVSELASFLLRIFSLGLKLSGCVRVVSPGSLIGREGEKVNFLTLVFS